MNIYQWNLLLRMKSLQKDYYLTLFTYQKLLTFLVWKHLTRSILTDLHLLRYGRTRCFCWWLTKNTYIISVESIINLNLGKMLNTICYLFKCKTKIFIFPAFNFIFQAIKSFQPSKPFVNVIFQPSIMNVFILEYKRIIEKWGFCFHCLVVEYHFVFNEHFLRAFYLLWAYQIAIYYTFFCSYIYTLIGIKNI